MSIFFTLQANNCKLSQPDCVKDKECSWNESKGRCFIPHGSKYATKKANSLILAAVESLKTIRTNIIKTKIQKPKFL
jgi:hypothetical protein